MLKLTAKCALGIVALGVNVAVFTLPNLVNADSQSTTTGVGLSVNPVIISYSSGPTVTLGAITPDATGEQSTASDTVSADTNDTSGLSISLQDNSPTSTSMLSGSNAIDATAGTTSSPATLANGEWGWRIDGLGSFGSGPTTTISDAAPSSLTFAGIPANGSPASIASTGTNGSTSSTVWYSARVNDAQVVGNYDSTVLYTISTN